MIQPCAGGAKHGSETLWPDQCIKGRENRRRAQMSRFCFSVSGIDSRQEGVIESDSFLAAVDALGQHVTVQTGDRLEIGVLGFPPMHYECVGEISTGYPVWRPSGQRLAA
jgi:hypothetical protein